MNASLTDSLGHRGGVASVAAAPEGSAEALAVRAVAGGDRDAFAALCRRHAPVLHRFATRMLGEPADAEDVVQETLLRFWREARKFDPEQTPHDGCTAAPTTPASISSPPAASAPAATPHRRIARVDSQRRNRPHRAGRPHGLPERRAHGPAAVPLPAPAAGRAAAVMDLTLNALESLLSRARRRP